MGCSGSSEQAATTEQKASRRGRLGTPHPSLGDKKLKDGTETSSQPTRSESVASRVTKKSQSVMSSFRRSLSRSVSRHRTGGMQGGTPSRKTSEISRKSSRKETVRLPTLLSPVGPPLSAMECVFDQKCFKCRQCGNQGLNRDGRPCRCCPYGGKRPPTELIPNEVVHDCSTLQTKGDGTFSKPVLKLGIRGNYVFAVNGLRRTPPNVTSDGAAYLLSYASSGDTLEHVLHAVQTESDCSKLEDLIDMLPDIVSEATSMVGVNALDDWKTERDEFQVEAVNAVVYRCVNAEADADEFLEWLDTAGFEMFSRDGDLYVRENIKLHAGIRHDRRALRLTFFRDGVCVDAVVQSSTHDVVRVASAADRG